jgi:putative MATE family efflux protein
LRGWISCAALSAAGSPTENPRPPTAPAPHLLDEPPLRAILRLAMPTTLVMLLAATSNTLYTYYVSRLGADAIAAVSLVFPFSLLATTAMQGGLGSGAAAAVARALGAGRRHDAARVAEHAMVLAVAVGVAVGIGVVAGAPGLFGLMGGRGAVLDGAVVFARVIFGGAVITFTAAMLDSVMRGEGNVRVPSIWGSVSLVLQIVLTPLFMFVLHLGLVGAPIAMLASQGLAAVPRLRHVFGGRGIVTPAAWPQRLAVAPLAEILRVGIPASLSTTINYGGLMVLTAVVARLGDAHLAAYGLGSRLDFLLMSFAYGFGAAVLTLVGMTTGARRPDRALGYVLRAAAIISVLMLVPAVLLCWRPTLWIGLFTHDPAIVAVGTSYFRIVGPSYPFVGLSMVSAFAFQGFGRATTPLVWMTARVVTVLAVSLLCTQWLGMGDQAVFAAVSAANMLSAVVMFGLFVRTEHSLRAIRIVHDPGVD